MYMLVCSTNNRKQKTSDIVSISRLLFSNQYRIYTFIYPNNLIHESITSETMINMLHGYKFNGNLGAVAPLVQQILSRPWVLSLHLCSRYYEDSVCCRSTCAADITKTLGAVAPLVQQILLIFRIECCTCFIQFTVLTLLYIIRTAYSNN